MKLFAIIQTIHDVHIQRTDKRNIPRQLIIAEADTYEEAVAIRDQQRLDFQDARSLAADRWHNKWNKAEKSGNLGELNRLAGVRY